MPDDRTEAEIRADEIEHILTHILRVDIQVRAFYDIGDEDEALERLAEVYEDVWRQIRYGSNSSDKAITYEDVKIPGPGPEGIASA